jgi:hypothetical protein
MKTTIAALLLAATTTATEAGCLPAPKYNSPGPGQIYGCPVYTGTSNKNFWFSISVETIDNKLYGFALDTNAHNASAKQIADISVMNWKIVQETNAYGIDFAMVGITFSPTNSTLPETDYGDPIYLITGDIRQGF